MKLIAASLTAGLIGAPAFATVVAHSTQTGFNSAVVGQTLTAVESFEASLPSPANDVTFGSGIRIQSYGVSLDRRQFETNGPTYLAASVFENYDFDGETRYQIWTLASGTTAFAFDFRGIDQINSTYQSVRVSFAGGGVTESFTIFGTTGVRTGFIGFTSDMPFTQVLFDGTGGSKFEDDYWIDNVVTYARPQQPDPDTGAQVPLPAGLPLLAGGLLAFGLLGRRRKG